MKTLFCFILAASSAMTFAAEPLELEPDQGYVYAQDRIPNFKEQRKPNESWLLDPTPKAWRKISLNGQWNILLKRQNGFVDYFNLDRNFGIEEMPQILKSGYDFGHWEKVDVPLPLAQFKPGSKYNQGFIACYQRTLDVPKFSKESNAVYLKFHGAGFRTDVWIDGAYVGSHIGVFAPFEFDITSFIKPGRKASLVVKCVDSRYMMRWHDLLSSGLITPVELEIRNVFFADKIKLACDITQEQVNGQFKLTGNATIAQAQIVIEEAKSGKQVGMFNFEAKKGILNSFSVKLDNPHYWSPEDPFLYVCKIKLNGKDAGISRFGFRTMRIKTDTQGRQHFYLNGKRLYLRIFEFNNYWFLRKSMVKRPIPNNAWSPDYRGQLREALLAMKFANVNTLRPHGNDQDIDETFFNLCDELGFIVNLDWHGAYAQRVAPIKKGGKPDYHNQDYRIPMLEKNIPAFKATLLAFHNHPSLCLISFGNEFYDHQLSSGSFDDIIEKYTVALHQVDLQKRPTSGSAGRPTYKHDAKVDFVDDHQYIGVYYGSYQNVVPYIKTTSAAIKNKFGVQLPFINTETGYVSDDRIHPVNYKIFNRELRKDMFDKNLYIKAITGNTPERAWARLAFNGGGVRAYYTDLPEFKKRKALLFVKRYIEMFRMNRKYTDGVSLNTTPESVAAYSDPDSPTGIMKTPWPKPGKLAIIDPIFAFRKAFAPVQVFVAVKNYHLFSGASTKAPIMLINDSLADVVVDLVIQLRDTGGAVTRLLSKKSISVTQADDVDFPFEFVVPSNTPSGKAVLETYLLSDGQKIAENSYDIYTVATKDRITQFPSVKLALYDTAGAIFAGFGGKTTRKIMKSLKIPFTQIKDFNNLAKYQVLIIGANAMDHTLAKSGSEIASWITAGGRLLMFEQYATGPIPWSNTDRIYRMSSGSFMEHYFKNHPAFKGIENEMAWESPLGKNRELFETCLELNDSFLSIAVVSHPRSPASPKAIITDRRTGKGEYLISMVKATDRFGKDATMTRYIENLLAYIMSDSISKYAVLGKDTKASTTQVIALEKADAFYVNLSKAANRGFRDDASGNGWAGFGSGSDMRNLKPGMNSITGLVPFKIIDPTKNGGQSCIVLAGPKREQFPKASAVIPIGRKCESLFFLHTAMYVKAKAGDSILDYEIIYADGSRTIAPMRLKFEIADWWKGRDYPNARLVYREGDKCLYATVWVNPTPEKMIAGIRAISKGNAIPIILAISAKSKNKQQRINRTELDDNRK